MARVLELGSHAAGYFGRLAVQAGYDVVRVESEASWPAWASEPAMAAFLHAGKRRVRDADQTLMAQLAEAADIVVLDAPDADSVCATGFDEFRAAVKVAITPFGRTGPKRNWKASPNVLLAMGGYTYLSGDPERAPLSLPGHYVEFQAGALAFAAACAQHCSGRAAAIDVGMLEVVMALSQFTTVLWHCKGEIRRRHGSDFWSVCPVNLFRCADGWVFINIVPSFWDPFTVFLERPELLLEPRFATNEARMSHREELHALIDEVVGRWTRSEVDRRATEARIPVGLVLTLDEVLSDPHLATRSFWDTVRMDGGEVCSPRGPWHVTGHSPACRELEDAEDGECLRVR